MREYNNINSFHQLQPLAYETIKNGLGQGTSYMAKISYWTKVAEEGVR